ncbi:MAG: efflux RND transporter permease subunit [Cyanobacteriota bacterium]|nr:efflux RND transporter permease subunit [Cyanobacteriota bacterium]
MSKLFYRNVRLLILTLILIFVWGVSSYINLPRLEDPELVSRVSLVTTFLPGATAERVEALVTDKIEEKISEIEEINLYESTSRAGVSVINMELLDSIKAEETDVIWTQVRNKLDEAKLEFPEGASEPELDNIEVKAYALIAALTWEQNDEPNYAILNRVAESLEDRIQAMGGTEKTEIIGKPDEEIVVEINPVDLSVLGLTAQDLSRQIQQSDAKTSAGQLREFNNNLSLEISGELESIDRLRQIPISYSNDSQFVRLGDIARVRKATVEPVTSLAIVSDKNAIVLGVYVDSSFRLDRWAKTARQTIDEFRQQLPKGLKLSIIFDQSSYVEARLNSLILNLLLGGILVFGVTLFMMGWQSATIVGLALPLSILMVLGLMGFLGIPLHQMSITGLIVALGILIDTAIVMVDEITQHLNRGVPPEEAIAKSVGYLGVPLLSSTLTTILAFMPIVLLPGPAGEFVGTIAVNVILAISSSFFLTLTVIPALAAKLHRRKSQALSLRNPVFDRNRVSDPWWQIGFSHPWLTRGYRKTINFTTAKPVLGIILALMLPAIGFIQAGTLEQQFFPAADRDQLQIEFELPPSVSIAKTESIVREARKQLIAFPEITDVRWFVGESAPSFYYNLMQGRSQQAHYAQALIQLNALSSAELARTIQAEMDAAFPEVRVLVRQLEQGPPFDAPIEMRIYGSDLDRLRELGEQIRGILAKVSDVTHTRADLSEVLPQLKVRVDEEQARLVGLDNRSIAQQLNTALEGIRGGSILESTEELPVRVRLSNVQRGNLEDIASLYLLPVASSLENGNSNRANLVPLSALGEVELTAELAKINRRNGQRVNTVQGFISAGVLPATVLERFEQELEASNFQPPPGYRFDFGGEAEQRGNAVGNLFSTVGVLAVLMVATLVLSLASFQLAALIGVVAIASIGLGLFSIWIFGYPFGFNPIIGTIGLVGVAINDSIVVLAALLDDPAARMGDRQAIRSVVMHSTRHVLTTTFTTTIGFVPLFLGGGDFWPPLAIAIAGGVGGATLLALYLIPSAYVLLTRGRQK